jgi:hypothetical protein
MTHPAPLTDAKNRPDRCRHHQRNYPLCLEPSIALRPDFSCCIPRNLCLFNCPLHLTATQAVANFGDGGENNFSQIGSGFAQRSYAAYGDGAYDHGLARRSGHRRDHAQSDGRLWIDRLTGGPSDTGKRLSAEDGERIVRLVAHHVGAEVHSGSPRLSAELPETGERFEGLIAPIVAAPAFAIRQPAVAIFTLADARAGIMAVEQAELLYEAVSSTEQSLRRARRNGV